MSTSPANKFASMVKAKRPDALEMFTDRDDEQKSLRQILSPRPTGDLEGEWKNLLTVFYGVGGVGKTTLRKQARKIAGEEFPSCTCVVTDFDGDWTPEIAVTLVFAELCRSLVAEKIAPVLTLTLLALDRQSGEKSPSLDERYGLVFDAMEKGAGLAPIPYLDVAMKGVKWLAQKAHSRAIRERINELNLSPEEHEGRINLLDLQAKLPLALFHDISGWLAEKPERQLVWLIDGFERVQGRQPKNDAQSRLRELIREFSAQEVGRFRAVVFGREKLDWADLYHEPWQDISTQHCLGGLAEVDARDFLHKSQVWLQGHGQVNLAEAIARHADRILDASDENVQGQRAFYPFYLNLSLDIVERALASGKEPDLGTSPMELRERFFRYLDEQEKQALKVLALAEVFDEMLFNWLVTKQLIVGFPLHSFDTELRKGRSYFLPVEHQPGWWRFHKLMEDALQVQYRSTEQERALGQRMVKELLGYYGEVLKQKPERDWTDADAELWRRGMEIIVTQGPELGLLKLEDWKGLLEAKPWSIVHHRCLEHRIGFAKRILQERERALGPDHPDTLGHVCNLAGLLSDKGDYAGAEKLYRRALAGREKVLGPDHPDTLSSAYYLARQLFAKGDYAGAERLHRQAFAGREKILGPEHPDTLNSVNKLALLLNSKKSPFQSEDELQESKVLYRRALEGMEKVLDSEHPDTLSMVNNLGILFWDRGDYDRVEALFRRALVGMEKSLGLEHPETLKTIGTLAGLLNDNRRGCDEAVSLFRRALEGKEKLLGSDHPNTLDSAYRLACLLIDRGDFDEAKVLYLRVLDGMKTILGPKHPETLRKTYNLARHLKRKQFDGKSEAWRAGVRYTLICYECLSGNIDESKRLLVEEIAAKPATREQVLKDDDLKPIHDFIRSLPLTTDKTQQAGKTP